MELGTCPVTLDGIGDGGCVSGPIMKFINCIIPEAESHSYASLSDFNDEDVNKGLIASKDLLPLKIMEEMENVSTEELTSETSSGTKLFHRNGKRGFIGMMLLTPDQNRILQSYDGRIKKVYLMDDEGNRLGTSPDGTSVTGLAVSYFKVKPMDLPLAADGSAWSRIEVQLEYNEEIDKQGRYSIADELDWIPKKVFKPLTKLTLTPGTISTFVWTCAIAYVDPTTGKSRPATNIGTDGAEFTIINQTGSAETVTVAPTATEGTYTFTGTTITSGTMQLDAAADRLYYSDQVTLAST